MRVAIAPAFYSVYSISYFLFTLKLGTDSPSICKTVIFLVVKVGQAGRTGFYVFFNAGRGGETIRSICKASGAKITCDKESEGTLLLSRLIKISGTQKEVAAAKASS